jgi:LAO/AO transport system kinase
MLALNQKVFCSFRSGSPGSGKSTFIESLGMSLLKNNNETYKRKIAVLAVDPSSAITGGSLLGDKTRMHYLSRHPDAYIRPSPNLGHLGGITRSTAEAIIICEAAGYDVILIETVGVGQSEYHVAQLADVFALLVSPSGGDEIQAIKKGIVELANIIVVTKSDGDLIRHARKMSAEFISATKYINIGEKPKVRRVSSLTGDGIDLVWEDVIQYTDNEEVKLDKRRVNRVKLLRSYLLQAILDQIDKKHNLKEFENLLRNDDSVILWDVVDQVLNKIAV